MRLTKKQELGGYQAELLSDSVQKLGQLEDIEEELGIDLLTLKNMFTNGIWFYNAVDMETKKPVNKVKVFPFKICEDGYFLALEPTKCHVDLRTGLNEMYIVQLSFRDMNKKTFCSWALTKEELEDGN